MEWVDAVVPAAAAGGGALAAALWRRVGAVRVRPRGGGGGPGRVALLGADAAVEEAAGDIQDAIAAGAASFLGTEYLYMSVFVVAFAALLVGLLGLGSGEPGAKPYSGAQLRGALCLAGSFVVGALTSVLSGFMGMRIATFANARTALEARAGVAPAFQCAFRAGGVMGLILSSLGLAVLFALMWAYRALYGDDWAGLFEALTGYGLGGSAMALFGRVGGGIYTKAADVGADLVGKVEQGIPEDDPRNPAVIADNVGDNVGDIAGMGSDLFGSFAESTCAALVVSSLSSLGKEHEWAAMNFPLVISAVGIFVSMACTLLATELWPAREVQQIEPVLRFQLQLSTAVMVPCAFLVAKLALPGSFDIVMPDGKDKRVEWWAMALAVSFGLVAGYVIGHFTEVFTSHQYPGVREVANSCRTGAATNVIYGLALGYKSCIVPAVALSLVVYGAFSLAGMYGIACAALGMLGTLSTCLAIDAYGPISDNAGGIAEMAGMGEDVRQRTDALDAAGNTTAAIGKGFAIGSAALVSLALFGAFVARAGISVEDASILNAKVFPGLLLGAMLPYWFSAMTMKAVGRAALEMVEEVRRQFRTIPGIMQGTEKPDYDRCVSISTRASLVAMGGPGALVLLTPILVGVLFGTQTLSGVLVGALVSGVQMATSAANTGGAWDNAKKYLEAGETDQAKDIGGKGTDAHHAAVIGDTVGDPLKDTSGPSLNILIKLMAVESLVLAPFFAAHTPDGLLFKHF